MLHVAKVYKWTLGKRIREITQEKLNEWQQDLDRGDQPLTWSLHQRRFQKDLQLKEKAYVAFVDLEKAFDRIPIIVMRRILGEREYEMKEMLIKAT